MSIYLLEVGTEELPYKFIPQAISQLKTGFTNFLNDNKVKFSDIIVYATPRRLSVIVDGLENKTADEEKIVKGPIKTVAFDENGTLTKAGEGFARKNAVYLGNELPAEMLVFSGMTSEQIDLFLAEYRKMGISPIACKAVITPVNIFWDAGNLAEELLKEHNQLHKDPGI